MSAPTPEISSAATLPELKFTSFSDLPRNFALPGRRVLKLNHFSTGRGEVQFSCSNALSGLGMLHTNAEAREVVLRALRMMPDCQSMLASPLYFNVRADKLYFETLEILEDFVVWSCEYCVRESGVRRVAVGVGPASASMVRGIDAAVDAYRLWDCVTAFARLREGIIIMRDTDVWRPECDLMQMLVRWEERAREETAEEGLGSIFAGTLVSEFQWGGESLGKYHWAEN